MKKQTFFYVCGLWSLGFLLAFVGCKPDGTGPPSAVIPESPLVALTPTEYNNTIRDLFGMPDDPEKWPMPPGRSASGGKGKVLRVSWPWSFPAELGVEKFEGMALGQATSPYKIEQLQLAASYFSEFALLSKIFFACANWSKLSNEKQKSCAWESIVKFAQRAWRRPMAPKEHQKLQAFFEGNWKGGGPSDAVKLTVAGVLQSAAFVYRVELGDANRRYDNAVAYTSWELASRLSYFLWDSMPDPMLFQAAANGQLRTREQVAAQARRMLESPKARRAVVHFHNQLLGLTDIHTINPSRELYGPVFGFTPKAKGPKAENDMLWPRTILRIRQSMLREAELFVERTIFDGAGTLRALFTDHHGYMSSETRAIYGPKAKELPGPKVSWQSAPVIDVFGVPQITRLTLFPAEFPKSERAGLLTLPAVLALYSHAVHPSPILRGKFVATRLACVVIPPPPAEAFGKEPADTVGATGTNRERTEAVTQPSGCIGCHQTLDPPGFALENFDSLGRWRDKDNGKPVNARATVKIGGETYEVSNAVELARKLSTSNKVRDCYTLRWLRYATGVQLKSTDSGVQALQEKFRINDNVKELLVSIATSDLFRYRNPGGRTP